MRLERWAWVLFAVVAIPLAVNSDMPGIVHVALPLALVADTGLVMLRHEPLAAAAGVVSNLLAAAALVLCLTGDDVEPLVRRVDSTTVALLIFSRGVNLVGMLYRTSHSTEATVIRTFAYALLMFIVQVLLIVHVHELAKLLDSYTSVAATTRAVCKLPTNSTSKGFIFSESPFITTCPTRVWEHARMNMLFASQMYVLYTITTDLWVDHDKYKHYSIYLLGGLATLECLALSAAVGLQFDVIEGCDTIGWGVGILLLVAVVAYVVRQIVHRHLQPQQVADRRCRPPLKTLKLKL